MLKEFCLEGKNALVTGGGTGIGKAIALVLAEAGANVAVAARTFDRVEQTAKEIHSLGRRSIALQTDVSDSKQVNEMVEKATCDLGGIDILVNNAGVSRDSPTVPLPDPPPRKVYWDHRVGISDDLWHRIMETNLSGAFYGCRAVAPQMLERQSGKIINVGSINSILACAYSAAYDSSKAGLKMLTKVLALEWAPYGINVNGIGPGWFATELSHASWDDTEMHESRVARIPMRRLTDLRDLGLLAVYLASPASDWMTGQMLYLDGGQSAVHS